MLVENLVSGYADYQVASFDLVKNSEPGQMAKRLSMPSGPLLNAFCKPVKEIAFS